MVFRELNSAQRRFFLLDQIEGGSARTLLKIVEIDGVVDRVKLKWAVKALVEEQPMLRSSIVAIGEKFGFYVHPVGKVAIRVTSSKRTKAVESEDWLGLLKRPFKHGTEPLCRIHIRHWSDGAAVAWSVHHSVFDEYSGPVLLSRLGALYESGTQKANNREVFMGGDPDVPKIPLEVFWKKTLSGCHVPTMIEPNKNWEFSPKRSVIERHISDSLTSTMRNVQLERGCTHFSQFAGAVSIALAWYLNQHDITLVTSAPSHERASEDWIGCYQNTLPLVFHVRSSSFEAFADYVQDTVLLAYEHSGLPVEEIVAQAPHLTLSSWQHKPLSDVFVGIERGSKGLRIGESEWVLNEILPEDTEYPLSLTLVLSDGSTSSIRAEWRAGQIREDVVNNLLKHLEASLRVITTVGSGDVGTVSLLDDDDLTTGTSSSSPVFGEIRTASSVVESMAQEMSRSPIKNALMAGSEVLSSYELLSRSKIIGSALRANGVYPGDRVAVALPRDMDLLPTLFGVLWAGGSFVPIDEASPENRVSQMLRDSQPKVILSKQMRFEGIATFRPCDFSDAYPECEMSRDPSLPMYIMYTSGSTGLPKGVVVDNANILSMMAAVENRISTCSNSVIAATSLSFDISALELFWPICYGREVFISDHKRLLETSPPAGSVYQCTPTIARTLAATDPGRRFLRTVRTMLIGGEALTPDLASHLQELVQGEVWNCYGPTETTVWSLIGKVNEHSRCSIGWPLNGEACFVVDQHDRPLPVGWRGRLIIGGDGVARGYWNQPELTATKFRPFPTIGLSQGYDTGDLVTLDPDRGYIFEGRIDSQVKVGGQRIELQEIETLIRGLSGVDDAAVVVIEGEVVGCVQFAERPALHQCIPLPLDESTEIRNHLSENLSPSMVPQRLFAVTSFPQLPSGKLDRRTLISWLEHLLSTWQQPQSQHGTDEALVVNIWSQVLGRDLNNEDNLGNRTFFQLGGTSLGVLKVFHLLSTRFPHIKLADLFTYTTVRSLTHFLNPVEEVVKPNVEDVGRGRFRTLERFNSRNNERGRSADG